MQKATNGSRSVKNFIKPFWWEILFVTILLLYPLRHAHWGLDFWDTGYSYANFAYMGTEHMDSMWLFSTYLANAVGNFLMKLPGAGSLLGMNVYTGLIVSVLALIGYFFCTRKLGMARRITFAGEFLALSLCWCPTASLYNYLTYFFFLLCVVFLYIGLTEEKRRYLFAAGVCLGMNILVRFSNVPEAGMIVAVWVYAYLSCREQGKEKLVSRTWKRLWRDTLWCLGGYLSGLAVLLGWIQIRYGLDNYVQGILRLFAMTDNAADYKATSMVTGMLSDYLENLYWAVRIGVIVLGGVVGFAVIGLILHWGDSTVAKEKGVSRTDSETAGQGVMRMNGRMADTEQTADKIQQIVWKMVEVVWLGVAALMIYWLYHRGFCDRVFYTYGPMRRPGILFLMLVMGVAAVRIFHPKCPKEEKLISGMMILVVLLTSLGSNNKTFPSLNNLFVAAPYALWECRKFVYHVGDWCPERTRKSRNKERLAASGRPDWCGYAIRGLVVRVFPVKVILLAFLGMFYFQSVLFGANFFFAEASGAQNVTATVDNNAILKNIKMSPEKAEWMSGISGYVKEEQLQGREVILYGAIPGLSYYLQMPSAYNPWSELRSYDDAVMEQEIEKLSARMERGECESPIIIFEKDYYGYLLGGEESLESGDVAEPRREEIRRIDRKTALLRVFIEKFNYDLMYENGKFFLLESRENVGEGSSRILQ